MVGTKNPEFYNSKQNQREKQCIDLLPLNKFNNPKYSNTNCTAVSQGNNCLICSSCIFGCDSKPGQTSTKAY